MKFGDILVTIDESATGQKRAELALALAVRSGARLTGYHLPQTPRDDPRRARQTEETEAAAVEFGRRLKASSLDGVWVLGSRDDGLDDLLAHARCTDLVVAGLGIPDAPDADPQNIDIERLVIESGRPVLGVPIIDVPPNLGERILIAWDGSRPCTRAVHDALPFLRDAGSVAIVSVDDEPNAVASAHGLAGHLGRLGIDATIDTSLDLQLPVGEEILSRIERNDIDLLVAGAYGHSRLRERLFGGASRTLLHQMMVPVLVSH